MSEHDPSAVQISRRYDEAPEPVFDAWLDPEHAGRWLFATPTGRMVRVEMDARVGGRFTITRRDEGDDTEHVGEYLEVDRPRRLVFTFGVPRYDEGAPPTRVTVHVEPDRSGCLLTLTHEGVPAEWTAQTLEGWEKILEGLAREIRSTE